jgi:hypothetical protein
VWLTEQVALATSVCSFSPFSLTCSCVSGPLARRAAVVHDRGAMQPMIADHVLQARL